jgi:decaprenyl-phosphate phosphoribosyltransferase
VVEALRPRQWVKNVLVLAAPGAAGVLHEPEVMAKVAVIFVAFCAASSSVYLVNDAIDAPADRLHPTKASRPIARGDVSVPLAYGLAVVLAVASFAISWGTVDHAFAGVLATYLTINVAYCTGLKRVPVIELGAVASGFILRAAGGGAALHLPLSKWFLAVVSFSALFIVTGKRMGELQRLGEHQSATRAVLAAYTRTFLQAVMTLSAGVAVTTYCLWTFDKGIPHAGHLPRYGLLELTTVPVVLGVLRVLQAMDAGEGGSPEDLVYRDHILQVLGLLFAGLFAVGLYG